MIRFSLSSDSFRESDLREPYGECQSVKVDNVSDNLVSSIGLVGDRQTLVVPHNTGMVLPLLTDDSVLDGGDHLEFSRMPDGILQNLDVQQFPRLVLPQLIAHTSDISKGLSTFGQGPNWREWSLDDIGLKNKLGAVNYHKRMDDHNCNLIHMLMDQVSLWVKIALINSVSFSEPMTGLMASPWSMINHKAVHGHFLYLFLEHLEFFLFNSDKLMRYITQILKLSTSHDSNVGIVNEWSSNFCDRSYALQRLKEVSLEETCIVEVAGNSDLVGMDQTTYDMTVGDPSVTRVDALFSDLGQEIAEVGPVFIGGSGIKPKAGIDRVNLVEGLSLPSLELPISEYKEPSKVSRYGRVIKLKFKFR